MSRFEARGTPGDDATAVFQLLAEDGFNLGKDKKLNEIMSRAVHDLLESSSIHFTEITSEKKLEFCPLIPDNAVYLEDRVQCLEYTWRKGQFLDTGNRAAVASYILTKLQNYARELGWVKD